MAFKNLREELDEEFAELSGYGGAFELYSAAATRIHESRKLYARERGKDPHLRAKRREYDRAYALRRKADPVAREKRRARDLEAYHTKEQNDPEYRAQRAARSAAHWRKPGVKEHAAERKRARLADPEKLAHERARQKAYREANKEKRAAYMRAYNEVRRARKADKKPPSEKPEAVRKRLWVERVRLDPEAHAHFKEVRRANEQRRRQKKKLDAEGAAEALSPM